MYQPSEQILEKYAKVLVEYACNETKGMQKGDIVLLQVPESAKPLLVALRNQVLKSGGHPLIQYLPDDMARDMFELASDEQLKFLPETMLKGRIDQVDHAIHIHTETNKEELKGIDPKKIMMRSAAFKPYIEWQNKKETDGKFTWVLAMYATQEMADEVDLTLEEYWQEIIKACYLDQDDPVAKWKAFQKENERVKKALDDLAIEWLHITSERTDLKVKLGKGRKWLGASGRNIPSFEIFISPDWRGTEGTFTVTQPLYRYGVMVKDIILEFKDGLCIKATASQGEKVLKEMISTENADKVGEFSLTDKRFSNITKFMGETVFDENVGGEQGNTHIALGNAYQDSFNGDKAKVTQKQWKDMGYNQSVVHTDVVSTEKRTVTATLADGSQKIIYQDGMFTI